jgi:hypothetical protein
MEWRRVGGVSEQRLEELGLPRREFLKRAAVGVFAAPLIVSFGLSGTAEAAAACLPNQAFSNQTHSLFTELTNTTWQIWVAENDDSLVDASFAKNLRRLYLGVVENVLNDSPKAFCSNLSHLKSELTKQSGRKIDADFASELLDQIASLRATYCGCHT